MCAQCKQTKDFGDPTFIATPEFASLLTEIATRVAAPTPIRICDDPLSWDWRAYLRDRGQC